MIRDFPDDETLERLKSSVESLESIWYFSTAEGEIVTTSAPQTLTNKTLTSPVINTPTINSIAVAGEVVETTKTQTLTNKTLTSPVVNTPTINSVAVAGEVVETTKTQTLTNKTLTSPVVNTPTINSVVVAGEVVETDKSQTLTNKIIRDSTIIGGLVSYVDLVPSSFTMDMTDVGADFGSGFSGLVSSIDFVPDTQGTIWTHFNFKSSGFNDTKDMLFDLHWIANGEIGSSQAVRITVKVWVVAAEGTPVAASPTHTQTTNITIDNTKTGKKLMSGSFLTLAEASIPTTCESILLSVTREAAHVDDTYTGTFQLINLVAREA